jgi:hypothetical protein
MTAYTRTVVTYENRHVRCLYCEEIFDTLEEWQRHNLQTHMVHETGTGPLPEEQTEEPDSPQSPES